MSLYGGYFARHFGVDPSGKLWGFVIDAGFAIWDTAQYVTGGIDKKEYAKRMTVTGASLALNAVQQDQDFALLRWFTKTKQLFS